MAEELNSYKAIWLNGYSDFRVLTVLKILK
jgi:hypothetical protein